MLFSQYDVVRILDLVSSPLSRASSSGIGEETPSVGDIATVLEVYSNPPGYELECCSVDGSTRWVMAFAPSDLVLEKVQ